MPPSPGPHLAQVTSLPVSPQVAVSPGMLVQGMALQPDRCVSLSRSHNGSEPVTHLQSRDNIHRVVLRCQ